MRLRKQKDRSSLDATSNGMSRKAWREYSRSHIEYVAPASSKSGGGEYSRRISSDSYTSIRKQKSRRKRLVVTLCTILAVIVIGGGAAAFGYVSFLNNQFHSGIEDMDALRESLVTSTSDEEPFYVLLMGTDGRPGEDTYRSDSILLARVDVPQKQVVLVSIPRDTYTYIEGVGSAKINAAHAYGGAAGAVDAIEDFAGVEISHYAEINFEGFKDLVDALGGVEVEVPSRSTTSMRAVAWPRASRRSTASMRSSSAARAPRSSATISARRTSASSCRRLPARCSPPIRRP